MQKLKRFVACLLAVSTIATAPGLEPYRAWAQTQAVELPAVPLPLTVPGGFSQPPAAPAGPILGRPAPAALAPLAPSASGLKALPEPTRALPGRDVPARAPEPRKARTTGLAGLLDGLRAVPARKDGPRLAQPRPETPWLSPSSSALRSASSARQWGEASFSALAGPGGPSAAVTADAGGAGLGALERLPASRGTTPRRPSSLPASPAGLAGTPSSGPTILGALGEAFVRPFAWLGRLDAWLRRKTSPAPAPAEAEEAAASEPGVARAVFAPEADEDDSIFSSRSSGSPRSAAKEIFYARTQGGAEPLAPLKPDASAGEIVKALSRSLGIAEPQIEYLAFQRGLGKIGHLEAWREIYGSVRAMQVREAANRRSAYREDVLGFRKAVGIVRVPRLKPLASDARTRDVILRLSRQFGLSEARIEELARQYRISTVGDREKWLGIYDALQETNAREFKRLDAEKYKEARRGKWIPRVLLLLAGASYAAAGLTALSVAALGAAVLLVGLASWKDVRAEPTILLKLAVGFFVRFPYHLFDMFLFGYFRQNISYHFFHHREDYLSLAEDGLPAKWLEVLMSKESFHRVSAADRLLATRPMRLVYRYFYIPFAGPLFQFLTRRALLAVSSAAALGVLGGFAPFLPMAFKLTAVPYLGQALVLGAHGLPILAGHVPLVGHALQPVFARATEALVNDLVLGPMLNTFILSTFLTFPRTVGLRLLREVRAPPRPSEAAAVWPVRALKMGLRVSRAAGSAMVPWTRDGRAFWKANLLTFAGLITVGAEIEGIMTYADRLDAGLAPAWKWSGHDFKPFHALGAAIERPKGQSPIPFGGAITWGSVLLHKAETWSGLHVSDFAFRATNHLIQAVHPNPVSDAFISSNPPPLPEGASIPGLLVAHTSSAEPFHISGAEKDQVRKMAEDMAKAGDLKGEIEKSKARIKQFRDDIVEAEERLKEVRKAETKVPEPLRTQYQQQLKALQHQRDQLYALKKLSERSDLKNPIQNAEQVKAMDDLLKAYDQVLLEGTQNPGELDSFGVKLAQLKAMQQNLFRAEKFDPAKAIGAASEADKARYAEIDAALKQVEELRATAQAELSMRDSSATLLQSAAKARNLAAADRRSGKEMLEFRKNFSRVAMVMDLTYGLNIVLAAEKSIIQMQALLDQKIAKINAKAAADQQNAGSANGQLGNLDQWKAQAQQTVDGDKKNGSDFQTSANQAQEALQYVPALRSSLSAMITQINQEDKGQSADAPTEYQRRLNLLPQLKQWRTTGYPSSNPNDFSKLSLSTLQSYQTLVNTDLPLIQQGINKINAGVPTELAGTLIWLVPGLPATSGSSPNSDQTLAMLSARQKYFNDQFTQFQTLLTGVNNMLDPNNSKTSPDDFGDPQPVSAAYWLNQEKSVLVTEKTNTQTALAKIDAFATQINGAAGTNLPMLSGESLTQLITDLPKYATNIEKLNFDVNTDQGFQAKMALLQLSQYLPYAGRHLILWAQADATVTQLQDAVNRILPQAQAKLQEVVAAMQATLNDVAADTAWVNQNKANGDRDLHSDAEHKALIQRKLALLNTLQTTLTDMQGLLNGVLIPYQQSAISSVDPSNPQAPYVQLYTNKLLIYNTTKNAYYQDLPWGLATSGGQYGDIAGSLAAIQKRRDYFNKDKKLLDDNQQMLNDRTAHHSSKTEVVFGETQPYSLYDKIDVYQKEKNQRATEINNQATQINQLLAQIDALAPGKYNLVAKYKLPTNIQGTGQPSLDTVNALVNNNTIVNLGNYLKQIGNENNTGSASVSVGASGLPLPTGQQPPITLPNNTQIALLSLQAAKIIVPSTANGPSLAYSVARYLFSDAIVATSQKWINERVPVAQKVLTDGANVLTATFSDLDKTTAYVNSKGASETADQVLDRELALITKQGGFASEAANFFNNQLAAWDGETISNLPQIQQYYNGLNQAYSNGSDAEKVELQAIQQIKDTLTAEYNSLETQRQAFLGWLSQLNNPDETAWHRVADNLSALQDKTRAILEANTEFHRVEKEYKDANTALQLTLSDLTKAQNKLEDKLADVDMAQLPPDLVARIKAVNKSHGSWLLGAGKPSQQVMVIPKSEFPNFLNQIITTFFQPQGAGQDLGGLKQQILANPDQLTQLIPDSKMLSFGDDINGFYLVYQSSFGTPYGLENSSAITFGNIASIGGNNISVNGYRFESPPSSTMVPDGQGGMKSVSTPVNAPYGDEGVSVSMESLGGDNWVNYLDVDFHRLLSDVPTNNTVGATYGTTRLMIFNDFAVLLFDNKLYFGAVGFGDMSLADPSGQPYYYGGNFKTSFQATSVISLNAEQAALFAKDPRTFVQTVNLGNLTYDPDLNKDFIIQAGGQDNQFLRTKIGPTVDVAKAAGWKDPMKIDLYWSNINGTYDNNQMALGASVLKGFSINRGQPSQIDINTRTTAEAGQKYDTYSHQVQVAFPKGWTVSAQGTLVNDHVAGLEPAYLVGVSKDISSHGSVAVSYGSPYIGINNRLTLSMNTAFTLGELWTAVAGDTKKELEGGPALEAFNKQLQDFFADTKGDPRALIELEKVFQNDVGKKLITQNMGRIQKDLAELYKAGAILDNTKVTGMIGFTSGPVGSDTTDKWIGGGAQVGSVTQLTLSKSQKALINQKIVQLYGESLDLQDRLVTLTRDWQATVLELVQAQWDMRLAQFAMANAPAGPIKLEASARFQEAQSRYDQAVLKYNMMTGRGPEDPVPFKDMTSQDLELLMANLRTMLKSQNRISQVLAGLSPDNLPVPKQGLNVMDFVPIFEQLTLSFGVTYSEILDNQGLGLGVTLRIPVYDPTSKRADHAMVLEDRAIIEQMRQVYEGYKLRSEKERIEAVGFLKAQQTVRPQQAQAAQYLTQAIAAYRNGLTTESALWAAYREWHWYTSQTLETEGRQVLDDAWSTFDKGQSDQNLDKVLSYVPGTPADYDRINSVYPTNVVSLTQAFDLARERSHGVHEMALREQSAALMMEAANSRVSKIAVDVHIGWNITASGVDWIPLFGLTGFGVIPILDLKLKPGELKELQVAQQQGNTEMYAKLKQKVEADLALQVYETYIVLKGSRDALALYESAYLPALAAALKAAQDAKAAGKGSDADVQKAQFAYDQAKLAAVRLKAQSLEAQAMFNFLMGDSMDHEVSTNVAPDEALKQLQDCLAKADPVGTRRDILDSRIVVARNMEQGVDKGLKLEEMQLEPVSMIIRSLARLIAALGDSTGANPEDAVKARRQTLEAERARRNFDRDLPVMSAQLQTQIRARQERLKALEGRTDPAAQLEKLTVQNDLYSLQGQLAMFAGSAPSPAARTQDLPASYNDLKERLYRAEEGLVASPDAGDGLETFAPGVLKPAGQGYVRYYHHSQSLGKTPINTDNAESWIELRMEAPDTPPEVLTALAGLQKDKADREYRTELGSSHVKAEMMLARFSAQVRLLRWLERSKASGASAGAGDLSALLRPEIEKEASDIKAALNLRPDITTQQLMDLVPQPAAGASDDVTQIAAEYQSEVQSLHIETLKTILFDQGLPSSISTEEQLIHQVRADAIAQRMSYKGFTPVVAFGLFRDMPVGGVFLEAPDPTAIEKSLSDVLGDSLREDLKAKGQLQAISLRLHSLMAGVQDGALLAEKRQQLAFAAESSYRGKLVQFQAGTLSAAEVEAARAEVDKAWDAYFDTLIALKLQFIELVAELQAIGYTAKPGVGGIPTASRTPNFSFESTTTDALLDYWTGRLLDKDFAAQSASVLAGLNVPQDKLSGLAAAVQVYRDMDENARYLRAANMSDADRLKQLTLTDAEGRRLAVRGRLAEILDLVGTKDPQANPAWGTLVRFMSKDMDVQSANAAVDLESNEKALDAIRNSYWRATKSPWTVQGAYLRLKALKADRDAKWQALLESYLSNPQKPGDFVMKDLALDAYLKSQDAYDQEVVRTFASKEVRADAGLARSLDTLFGLRASLDRRTSLLRYGRGMAAMDALIAMGQAKLAALQWQKASPEDVQRVSEAVGSLQDLRASWLKDPKELKPLYAVTKLDAQGNRLWTVDGWLTADDLALPDFSQRVAHVDGRLFLLPPGKTAATMKEILALGAPEIVGGVDKSKDDADLKQAALDDNQREAAVFKVLETAEFAKMPQGGKGEVTPLSMKDLYDPSSGLLVRGRVFYFASAPNERTGLRNAVHPLLAQAADPSTYDIWIYEGNKPLARDAFPTLESLQASDDFKDFSRVRMGEKGAEALAAASQAKALALRRAGWLNLKLYGYGFTLDHDGSVKDVYVTEDEWKSVLQEVKAAPDLVAKLPAQVEKLKADADQKTKADNEAQKALTAARDREKKALAKVSALKDARAKGAFVAPDDLSQAEDAVKAVQSDISKLKDKADDTAKDALKARNALAQLKQQLDRAKSMVEKAKNEDFFKSEDVQWTLAADGTLIRARALPTLGAKVADIDLSGGSPAAPARVVKGPVEAVSIEADGRIATVFASEDELKAAAPGMKLVTVDGRTYKLSDQEVSPTLRLRRYVDAQGRQVLLGQRILESREKAAGSELGAVKRWAYMPWNWGNILLETPKGIVKTPVEIFAGIDPNQEHYLGRVYMYKTDGGSTKHRGAVMTVINWLDVLDLIPDHVERFYDPSQFPDRVQINGPLAPGDQVFDKKPRDGDQDVHYGQGEGGVPRYVRYGKEDLESARADAKIPFEGGVDAVTVETRRGRGPHWKGGTYVESQVKSQAGASAVVDAANGGLLSGPDGSTVVTGTPDNMQVDKVQAEVRVSLGARQYDQAAKRLKAYPDQLKKQRAAVAAAGPELQKALAQDQADLKDARDAVAGASTAEQAAGDKIQPLAWRIGAEDAKLSEEKLLVDLIKRLKHQLAVEQAYLGELERLAARKGGAGAGEARSPGHPGSPAVGEPGRPGPTPPGARPPQAGLKPRPYYRNAVLAVSFGIVLSVVYDLLSDLLRRRRGGVRELKEALDAPFTGPFAGLGRIVSGWLKPSPAPASA